MHLLNLFGANAARTTTLAQQASRRRKALDAVAAKRAALVAAATEAALAASTAISPEMVDEAAERRAFGAMIGPGQTPGQKRYRVRSESGAMLAPVDTLHDTGHGAPDVTFTGKLVIPPDAGAHFERQTITHSLRLGEHGPLLQETRFVACSRPHHGHPTDARSTKYDALSVGAGRVISGQTRQMAYAPGQVGKGLRRGGSVFATTAGTGSVAYQSQCRMMSRWRGVLNAPAPAPRLAQPQPERSKRQPLPESVTSWRPLTVDGRKRRR